MENEFDYKKAAEYAISKLHGSEEVIRHIILSETYFKEKTLQDYAGRWWPDAPQPDTELLNKAILEELEKNCPDMLTELKTLRDDAGKVCSRLDNLLFYCHRHSSNQD